MIDSRWKFEPASKQDDVDGRTAPLAETWARLRPLLPVIPVTRVSDLTPLDRLNLPTYSAVTPLARDLTTHMGKGRNRESARISALMEAVERISAESAPAPDCRRDSLLDLGEEAADPRDFVLPRGTGFDPGKAIEWVRSWDLMANRPTWMARDLVVSPPSGEIMSHVDTNGLASGNTLLEATVHALCEVIERDAVSQLDFISAFGDVAPGSFPRLRLDSLPPGMDQLMGPIRREGLRLEINDIRSDVLIPVFRAMIIDTDYPGRRGAQPLLSPGYGANTDATLAMSRAITEAVQARIGFVQGARDSFNASPFLTRRASQRLQEQLDAPDSIPFESVETTSHGDLLADLQYLLESLRSIGVSSVIATDLTRADWGIDVVRVRVPGLTQFAVHRNRIGERCLRHLL